MDGSARAPRVFFVEKRGREVVGGSTSLEYFGNAFIHFESFDNAPDMLDQVVAGVAA
jgi:hypothetical protein